MKYLDYLLGGDISKQGYKDNSPYKHLPYLDIASNNITMKNVSKPLLGISNTGDTKIMHPNKEYKFNGTSVREYPIMQNGGGSNIQKVGNITFDSNLAKPLWNMQTGEPVLEVKANDGKAYKVVRRNNGSYEYYNPDADKNTLLYKGATAYESLPESKTKDIIGIITGVNNYRNYLRSGEELSKNPNIGNATKFVVNAIGSAPIIPKKTWSHLINYGMKGDIIKKGINWIPTIYETGKWAGKEAIQSLFQINPDEKYEENNEIDLSNPIMQEGGKYNLNNFLKTYINK